jgi:serine/threonine protein kinase
MAQVLVCKDIFNHRLIAAKTPMVASDRFSREARFWIGLGEHPNIVKAHIVHQIEDRIYLFMDFIGDEDGNSGYLRQAMTSNPVIHLPVIIRLGLSVVRALRHAQNVFPGFVHRDLKPENILMDGDHNFYVSDFGLGHIPKAMQASSYSDQSAHASHQFLDGSTLQTEVGGFVGTPGYAAPEQYEDSSSVDFRADLYSLGVVLYEVMTGGRPDSRDRPKPNAAADFRDLNETPGFSPGIFHELWDLTLDLLHRIPAYRPPSLEAVENAFSRMLSSFPPPENEITLQVPKNSPHDDITLSSRVHSFLTLGKTKLAIPQLIALQRSFPWSSEIPLLTRKIITHKNGLPLLRKLFWVDVSHPSRFLGWLVLLGCMLGSLSLVLPIQKLMAALCLMLFLLVESYINTRTLLTLNSITYSGILVGLTASVVFDVLGQPVLAGRAIRSFGAAFVALLVLLGIKYLYSRAIKYKSGQGLGAGTVKLIVMVATFVGFQIVPIMLIVILMLALQGFLVYTVARIRGDLKWRKGRVCPVGYGREIEIPVSTPILIAVWITLLWPLWRTFLW